jgi:uncharacterized iron-regulated membrane protein
MNPAFWRKWHRWIAAPAAIFILYASVTGFLVAFTEFFGEEETKREALRDVVSPVTLQAPTQAWTDQISRALATVASQAGNAPVDKITVEFKGDAPTVAVFTGKPTGGEDRKFVVDAKTGRLLETESYADKPLLYRVHSAEIYGDGGLVMSMIWGLALAITSVAGIMIYLRMIQRMGERQEKGLRRFFW